MGLTKRGSRKNDVTYITVFLSNCLIVSQKNLLIFEFYANANKRMSEKFLAVEKKLISYRVHFLVAQRAQQSQRSISPGGVGHWH